jgi:hypothetical protein
VKRTIVFYRSLFGCPFENFLDSLPGKIVQKITWMLSAVEDLESAAELFFRETERGEEIMECQFACGEAVFRILSFYQGREMVMLWGGIFTKFQSMRARQLEQAVRYKNDFMLKEDG